MEYRIVDSNSANLWIRDDFNYKEDFCSQKWDEDDLLYFTRIVNQLIQFDWRPQGGVNVYIENGERHYSQAMTL